MTKSKVLIVDDNPKNLQVLASLLTDNNYSIEVALNGNDAIDWVKDQVFDAILLDIMMPGMDGFETCKQIRQVKICKDIPIIFLTAREDIESITTGFNVGGNDYLTKPFNHEELLVRLANHIELKESRRKLADLNEWLNEEVDKKTIELKEANDKLRRLDDSKNDFLKSISHEIRTPLNGIVGSLNLLKGYSEESYFTEVIELLDRSVTNLEKYSYAALQIANLQLRGKTQLNLQQVDWGVIICDCVKQLSVIAEEKDIKIEIQNDEPVKVNADFQYLQSAMDALINTCIIFTESGHINIKLLKDEGTIVMEMEDSGSLFNGNNVEHFFDSINNQNYNFERNNAMELYLAKIIIESHGGTLLFDNKEDKSGVITKVVLEEV
ncbi:hybrid sensor histidine kinase/response regulator [Carboxylicivirga marina]|uniref:histidine kinase n=1 Tax=Carboxylicivirga marina TaxID=2800988 RepID=A0ABS1HH43_9BACT|nr:hybrid sensor histidine kinase/response regulator [Carboxylicivirga marina]MBK3516877.1 hybrid sensor histidine kinase/response regulator [Carboxylicivirga marina]